MDLFAASRSDGGSESTLSYEMHGAKMMLMKTKGKAARCDGMWKCKWQSQAHDCKFGTWLPRGRLVPKLDDRCSGTP